ncbi:hypothetical protein TNCV_2489441 [Trichonephila clavipes]|nr:hypothetical protein TNCV_2489441 [Trichonephila clavipes]
MRGKELCRWPYERLQKMASSCASRSDTNAGTSVSSPKGTTLKVEVLRCCELFSGKKTMEALEMLSKVYRESTMARSKVYEWHQRFKEGRESIEDNKRVGLPST